MAIGGAVPRGDMAVVPEVSLVVASNGSRADLERFLAVLSVERPELREVVVVRKEPLCAELRATLAASNAAYVEAPSSACTEDLRELGLAQTRGQVIVVREDHGACDERNYVSVVPFRGVGDRGVELTVDVEPSAVGAGRAGRAAAAI